MKTPFEVVPYIWAENQLGVLEPHPRPYIARGQRVWAIYKFASGQFYRWAYTHPNIAEAVAANLVQQSAIHHVGNFEMIPREVVIPRAFSNLISIELPAELEPKAETPEVLYLNH